MAVVFVVRDDVEDVDEGHVMTLNTEQIDAAIGDSLHVNKPGVAGVYTVTGRSWEVSDTSKPRLFLYVSRG